MKEMQTSKFDLVLSSSKKTKDIGKWNFEEFHLKMFQEDDIFCKN